MKRILACSILALAACTPTLPTMTHAEAKAMCDAEAAEAAQVVSGSARMGASSVSGPSFGLGIGINLTPRPHAETYQECMTKLANNGQILGGL